MRGSNFLRVFSRRRFLAFINSRRLAGTAGIDHAFGVKCAGMDAPHATRRSHGGVPKMAGQDRVRPGSCQVAAAVIVAILAPRFLPQPAAAITPVQRYRRRRRGVVANYIDEFIMFCVGLWVTGVGFGLLQSPFQARSGQQPWLLQVARHFKWMGPLLILIAIVLAFAAPS